MFKEKLLITYHALTPVHFGTGVSLSYVDNAIQREKHTDYPMLAGSGIKGAIRELALREWKDKDKVKTIFGPEAGENSSAYASCIAFTDAKILLFPVRSVRGVFAWITSPYVLKRFKSELESLGFSVKVEIPDVEDSKVLVCSSSTLKIDDNKVAFEEFVFEVKGSNNADAIATELKKYLPSELQNDFESRFAIVSDNVFRDFVKYAVEIRTRIRINQTTGTVEEGGLFTIELVPTEAVFYGFVFIADPYLGISSELYKFLLQERKNITNPKWQNDKSLIQKKLSENQSLLNEIVALKDKEIRIQKAWDNRYFSSKEIKEQGICQILNNQVIQFGGDETLGMGLMKVNVYGCQKDNQNQTGGQKT